MPHVKSSAITKVDYDEEGRLLRVTFTGGKAYAYLRVPPEEYDALMAAPSIGIHVNRRIKPNYEVTEVVSATR
jgi:KTSC domain